MDVCVYIFILVSILQVKRKRVRSLQLTSVVQERTQDICSILCFGERYYPDFRSEKLQTPYF